MSSNDKKELQETKRIQSFTSSTSDKVDIFQTSIDPSSEVTESHLREENSFPRSSIIAKDDDLKRIDTLLDTFKKEKQQPQKSPLPSFSQKSVHVINAINTQPAPNETPNSILAEQSARRTVTFDGEKPLSQSISNRSIHTSYENFRLSNRDSTRNDQQEKESINTPHLSDTVVDSGQMNFTIQDLNNLVSSKDFIYISYEGYTSLTYKIQIYR